MRLTSLKFVSEKREKDFNKLNIYTAEDLIRLFPRDYLDLTHVTLLQNSYHNDIILTSCEVLNIEANRYSKHPYVKALCQQSGKNSSQGSIFFTAECRTNTEWAVKW